MDRISMFGKNNKNPSILVHIKQDPADYTIKRRVELSSDGQKAWVIIEKETEKKAGWKVDITDAVRNGPKGPYIEVIRGQTRAIKFNIANQQFKDEPMTIDEYQQFINQKIFKAHYGKLLGDLVAAIKPWLLVGIIVGVIAIAVSGYNAYTLSKLPEQLITALKPTPIPTPPMIG